VAATATGTGKKNINAGVSKVPKPNPENKAKKAANKATSETTTYTMHYPPLDYANVTIATCNCCYIIKLYGILFVKRFVFNMEWLLFTYWMPQEPSRKRVFVWRQLKKIGAFSEGGGWLLPKTGELLENLKVLVGTVEEMGGTANLYTVNHFTQEQEERTISKFRQEREKEYSEIIAECHKALKHIEWESERGEFNFEEVEELEGDVEKVKHWYSEVRKRDFWDTPMKNEIEQRIKEVEEKLDAFTQKTSEEAAKSSNQDRP
jgi:hypothetical protein